MTSQPDPSSTPQQPPLEITTSRAFPEWLASMNAGLAFTTYQTGKLFFIGLQESGRLSIFERTLERVMGMTARDRTLWVSTLYQLWRFEDALAPGQAFQGYDRLYVPRESRVTGDVDAHDMAVDEGGQLVFVNTLFNCLATPDEMYSFRPLWQPPWITKLAPEDRCHLNGMAMRDGRPAFVTAVSRSDVADGWRDRRADGGVVADVASGEVVCAGLSMPHSPRWHQERLWFVNSGTGEFGTVDLNSGTFEPVCFCPGYARGLAFIGDWAVVGLSTCRENRTFQGLPLDERLREKDAEPRCGLLVVNTQTGNAEHWLRMTGVVRELYDVAVLPGCRRPMAVGFRGDEIKRFISLPPAG